MVIAWLVTQVLQVVFESFGNPDWVMKTVLVLLAAGLPFALIFAWAFEMTPEGLKREKEVDRSQSITSVTGRKLDRAIIGILVVALGYFIFDKFVPDYTNNVPVTEATKQEVSEQPENLPQPPTESDPSIAVLPFVNMSGDEENEYFSDGLTEELLNSLARVKELKVTGRTSSFAFKGKNTDLREIGKALGVAHILQGSVRKANNRVRITAQLINVEDGYHLWSDTFDRELDDIFAIQEEIATMVVKELTSTLLGDKTGPLVRIGTNNTQAYEAYLRGRYLFTRNPDDIQVQNEAEQLFQRAIDLDPEFTMAWYGQFFVMNFRHRSGALGYQEGQLQLRQLAEKIMAMDPELAESHVVSGRIAMLEMRWSDTEAAYRQALMINPGNINALEALSGLMGVMARPLEALEFAQVALARDPLGLQALGRVSVAYTLLGKCTQAEEVAQRALKLSNEASRFNGRIADCWLMHHDEYTKAIEWYEKEPLEFLRDTGLAIAYNKLGQQDRAQQSLDNLIELNGEDASYQYGQIYAQWGQPEKALDHLQHAWEIRDPGFILLKMDRFLDPIRDEPAFIPLMEFWQDPAKR